MGPDFATTVAVGFGGGCGLGVGACAGGTGGGVVVCSGSGGVETCAACREQATNAITEPSTYNARPNFFIVSFPF